MVLFELSCDVIDSVECGVCDVDWQLVKEVVQWFVFVEDNVIFDGYLVVGIVGICEGMLNCWFMLLVDVGVYLDVISDVFEVLCFVGVDGLYLVVFGLDVYIVFSEVCDQGYLVFGYIKCIVSGEIIWVLVISGGCVLFMCGGDYELYFGEDVLIGYMSYIDKSVCLYLCEIFMFLMLMSEVLVVVVLQGNVVV